MTRFSRFFAIMLLIMAGLFVCSNLFLYYTLVEGKGREYKVEINRLIYYIYDNGIDSVDLDDCGYVTAITADDGTQDFLEGGNSDYVIKKINGVNYRFDYKTDSGAAVSTAFTVINCSLGVATVLFIAFMLFLKFRLLTPFERIKTIPYELSKGNLVTGIKENKSKFFGRFLWGLDLLREKLSEQKENELKLQKEKKTLILSISHDIKTPLSAVKLYSSAIVKGLYTDEERKKEVAVKIGEKADEIEKYVAEIISASNDDFMTLSVSNGSFFLNQLADSVDRLYREKLELLRTEYRRGEFSDCLIKGDPDRANEVIQNLIENAIKYGDGRYIGLDFAYEEDCVLITVSDSGEALSENELLHIFDSFWRGSNTGGKNGSGLGLYICKKLMEKMDGDIFAKQEEGVMKVTAVFRKA